MNKQLNHRATNQIEQVLACPLTRRNFLRGLLATGALAAMPGGLLLAQSLFSEEGFGPTSFQGKEAYQTFRNACPRNCYDTCSIVSYVKDGVLQYIEGAPESTYTDGGLCVKGYAYPARVYSPDRIKYPMRQVGRGSGNWERISWDEALNAIADKILDMKELDGSLLGMALTKYSGNCSSSLSDSGIAFLFTSSRYASNSNE